MPATCIIPAAKSLSSLTSAKLSGTHPLNYLHPTIQRREGLRNV
jgi:hypothetical protein